MDYELNGHTAFLRIDDGKANAVGHSFLDHVNAGLDRAESEAKAVVLRGREGMFSAGFDLKEFQKGPEATIALVRRGFELLQFDQFPPRCRQCLCGRIQFYQVVFDLFRIAQADLLKHPLNFFPQIGSLRQNR